MGRDPDTPIGSVRNLGPVTAQWLREVEVHTLGDLLAMGAVEAYARLRFRFGRRVSRNALHALEAAVRDVDWRSLTAADKAALDVAVRARGRPDA
jgi:DNA transformation protein